MIGLGWQTRYKFRPLLTITNSYENMHITSSLKLRKYSVFRHCMNLCKWLPAILSCRIPHCIFLLKHQKICGHQLPCFSMASFEHSLCVHVFFKVKTRQVETIFLETYFKQQDTAILIHHTVSTCFLQGQDKTSWNNLLGNIFQTTRHCYIDPSYSFKSHENNPYFHCITFAYTTL